MGGGVSTLDVAIIIAYLVVMLGVGFFLGRNEKVEGFFANNRKTRTFLLIFTALSTSVGGATVLGMASAAYSSGISLGLTFAIVSILGWSLLAWLAPKIKDWSSKRNSYTFGDFFADRYSSGTRTVGSIVILLSYFALCAIQFVAFASLAEVVTGFSFEISLIAAALITILYTVFAGLKGDIYTDAIQFFVMIPIFLILFITGFRAISLPDLIASIPTEYFSAYNYSGPVFFWAGIVFGAPLLLVSMETWQRVFAAVDGKTARRAFAWSGVLKILFIAGSVLIGLMAFRLVPGVDPDASIFVLMSKLLPSGLLGLGFASILAILMSTIDSMIMVGTATITKDYYVKSNPQASEKQILWMGRLFAILFGLVAFIVALTFRDIVALTTVAVQIIIIFAPAILGGLLWKRSTAAAAFWSILVGLVVTIGLLPFSLTMAFVPAVLLAIVIFVVLSLLGSRKSKPATT